MLIADNLVNTTCKVGDKRVVARPIRYRYRTLKEKFSDAWAVFTGKADAVKFIGQ